MPDAVPNVVVVQPTKRWWRSKTLWFNATVAALAAAEATFAVLQPLLPGKVYPLIVFTLVVGNAVLRVISAKALTA